MPADIVRDVCTAPGVIKSQCNHRSEVKSFSPGIEVFGRGLLNPERARARGHAAGKQRPDAKN